jgi:hypothetical protein
MSDLVERLDEQAKHYSEGHGLLHAEAATEIKKLRLRIAELEDPHYVKGLEGK